MTEETIYLLIADAVVLIIAAGINRMFPRAPTWTLWSSAGFLAFVVMPLVDEGRRTAALSIVYMIPTWTICTVVSAVGSIIFVFLTRPVVVNI